MRKNSSESKNQGLRLATDRDYATLRWQAIQRGIGPHEVDEYLEEQLGVPWHCISHEEAQALIAKWAKEQEAADGGEQAA